MSDAMRYFKEYTDRVKADGGTIDDNARLKQYISFLKAQGRYDLAKFIFAPMFGGKLRTSGIYKYQSKLYSVQLAANDAAQTTELSQPYQTGNIAPNETLSLFTDTNTRLLAHPEITYTNAQGWTFWAIVNTNGTAGTTNIIADDAGGNSALYIKNTTNVISFKNGAGTIVNGTASTLPHIGKNTIYHFTTAGGDNTLKIYANGVLFDTITNPTGFTFEQVKTLGFSHLRGVHDGGISAAQVAADYAILRGWIPEIEQVTIGSQVWASSNLQAVATPVGNVIQEMQAAGAVEKITNGGFDSDTNWTKSNPTNIVIGSGVCAFNTTTNDYIIQSVGILDNKYVEVSFTVSNYVGGIISFLFFGIPTSGAWRNANGTYTVIVKVNSGHNGGFGFRAGASGFVGSIDDVSVQELGWSNATEIYDAVYAATSGTTARKEYAAYKAAAMWCNYNNDGAIGAVYGKILNGYAIKLLELDYATANFGWRITQDADWSSLTPDSSDDAIKKDGSVYWVAGNEGTNASGLTLLPNGMRTADGVFTGLNYGAVLWNSDDDATDLRIGAGVRLIKL